MDTSVCMQERLTMLIRVGTMCDICYIHVTYDSDSDEEVQKHYTCEPAAYISYLIDFYFYYLCVFKLIVINYNF